MNDSGINILLKLNKKYYFSGSQVRGFVAIKTKKRSSFKALGIQLKGQENIIKKQKGLKLINIFYQSGFILQEFESEVSEGVRYFPFAFKLPFELPGTYFQSDDISLKYELKAFLSTDQSVQPLQQSKNINIIEYCRDKEGVIYLDHEQCNKFLCCSYGDISVYLESDDGVVEPGSEITIKGNINLERSDRSVQNIRLELEQKLYMFPVAVGKVVVEGVGANRTEALYPILSIGRVEKRSKKQFKIKYKIPVDIKNSSMIGPKIIHYFIVKLTGSIPYFENLLTFLPLVIKAKNFPDTQCELFSQQRKYLEQAVEIRDLNPYQLQQQFPFANDKYIAQIVEVYELKLKKNSFKGMQKIKPLQCHSKVSFQSQKMSQGFYEIDLY